MASRRIDDVELENCRKWGIDVVEWKLGYQAVVLTAGPAADPMALTPREVFLALARRIPDPSDPTRLIDNPKRTWHDVDPRFDYRNIDVLARSASTRAMFVQLVWNRDAKRSHRSAPAAEIGRATTTSVINCAAMAATVKSS